MTSSNRRNGWLQLAAVAALLLASFVEADDVFLDCPQGELDSTTDIANGLRDTRDGGTLYLGPCTYYLASAVEARWNHLGSMQGKGKDLTFIKILPGAKIDGVPISAWEGRSWSTLFLFENPDFGNIAISDLSIVVTDPEPAGVQDDDDWWKRSLYNMIVVTGPHVDTRIERASFRGAKGMFFGFNVAHITHIFNAQEFQVPKRMNGDLTVVDCDFGNAVVTLNPGGILGGAITIVNNTFEDSSNGPMIEDCSDCTVKVTGNTFREVRDMGIGLLGTGKLLLEPSNYLVEGNSFYAPSLPTGKRVVVDGIEGSVVEIASNSP